MSYYRYITSVYKSYLPELNRTLRSSSVPRTVTSMDYSRYVRSTSVPPSTRGRYAASPFRDRASSLPPPPALRSGQISNFDYKVINYMAQLNCQDDIKQYVSSSSSIRRAEAKARYPADSFRSNYDYYDSSRHSGDYLYPVQHQVMGSWKHFNLSSQTLNERNQRATSPLVSRELTRYFGTRKRTNYLMDEGAGTSNDFRYYNYRKVPYMGGSDEFKYMKHKPFRRSSNGIGNGGRCI